MKWQKELMEKDWIDPYVQQANRKTCWKWKGVQLRCRRHPRYERPLVDKDYEGTAARFLREKLASWGEK